MKNLANSLFPDLFQYPDHVFPEGLHVSESFGVVETFALIASVAHVPVRSADDVHVVEHEEVVDRIDGVRRTAASDGNDSASGFVLQRALRTENVPDAVDKRFDFRRDV